jgi:hypothetical protein
MSLPKTTWGVNTVNSCGIQVHKFNFIKKQYTYLIKEGICLSKKNKRRYISTKI